MYNLSQLEMFVGTAETGSFSACARKLGKAQSAISQGIANLEIDFGVDVFDRSSRRAVLTDEGQRLLKYAQVILQQSEELNAAAASIVRQEEATIAIAIENALQMPSFGKVLYEFSQRFPATEIEVLSVASPDIVSLVESGRVELGIMLTDMSFKREVDLCYIGNIQLCAVCGSKHALSTKTDVEISEVAGYTQMILSGENKGELDHEVSISALKWRSNNVHCIIELIMQGNGWGYLPIHLVQQYVDSGKLHKILMRLDDKPWSPSVDMVTQKKCSNGVGLNWLIKNLKVFLD